MDNFCEYMYYLLTSPFKKVNKSLNQWYILCKVLGRKFDECMNDLYNARKESMIATCSDIMLPEHAKDRNLSRYTGEQWYNFRRRIATYTEVCRLGGTNQGVLLAVKALGYTDVAIVWAVTFTGDSNRWAEFFVVINMSVDDIHPIALNILKNEVRKTKEVEAKENYLFRYLVDIKKQTECIYNMTNIIEMEYFKYKRLNGNIFLDGMYHLDNIVKDYNIQKKENGVWQKV